MQGRRAGLVSRVLADAIDFVVILGVTLGAFLGIAAVRLVLHPRSFHWPQPNVWLGFGVPWILLVLYLSVGWAATGRTIGKQVMGLRVVNRRGERVRFAVAFVRALVCVAIPIGLVWIAVSSENRSLADLLLRTSVVYDWRVQIPSVAHASAPQVPVPG